MKTESLLKISFIMMFIGLFAIVFLSDYIEPSLMKIQDMNEFMLDEWVKINGTIIDVQNISATLILTLEDDTASIKVIEYNAKNLEFSEGMTAEVLGKVTEYKGELEISASKIIINA